MKFKKFEKLSIKKSKMQSVKGGTSVTEYREASHSETEHEIDASGKRTGNSTTAEFKKM